MPILSKVFRGEFIESVHVAYGVAVDKNGNVHLNVSPKKFVIGKIGKLEVASGRDECSVAQIVREKVMKMLKQNLNIKDKWGQRIVFFYFVFCFVFC